MFALFAQQLLKMRDELKQREAELEKSLEDKQQLKSQVQNLKKGLQKLQSTHTMQVSVTDHTPLSAADWVCFTAELICGLLFSFFQIKKKLAEDIQHYANLGKKWKD